MAGYTMIQVIFSMVYNKMHVKGISPEIPFILLFAGNLKQSVGNEKNRLLKSLFIKICNFYKVYIESIV
ncbi:hypothetical protein BAU22_20505 [Bacillus sp. 4048]|uniref:Uncharacterized protein n=1 Tax=Bacillus wiedmannii TaxID=1890302 RepID=A0AB73RM74_9BACI|nr:hypothetical protein DN392_14215 [Bacillus sp. BB51/4]OAK29702.1 hypothetical protein A6285_13435 [Bacillus wiedmannii]OJD43663.1 hypothetical protein BAU22_20505 [Bacillus sp. 4048]PEK28120.1 hypothetical protein CN694_03840 [Bacillus wiedmannii]